MNFIFYMQNILLKPRNANRQQNKKASGNEEHFSILCCR